ncbi:MAG: PaaI family thioesterase, partial [Alistipes sp.]|nr:PaaI family thioesterase [Alistipes sp.]
MKKIINPWVGEPTYHRYGCDPNNATGLKMEFYEDGDDIVCHWHSRTEFESWRNTLHGGVQAVLVDEIASWVIFRKFQTSGVTSHLDMRYKK